MVLEGSAENKINITYVNERLCKLLTMDNVIAEFLKLKGKCLNLLNIIYVTKVTLCLVSGSQGIYQKSDARSKRKFLVVPD